MPLGSIPVQAAEISALIVGPLLLLLSVMLKTRGGSLYQRRPAEPSRAAAGLGSAGIAIFLAGGLFVGLSAASHPEREVRIPGQRLAKPGDAPVAVAAIPPAAAPAPAPPAVIEPVPAAIESAAVPAQSVGAALTPGGALFKQPVVEPPAFADPAPREARRPAAKRRARRH